MISYKSKCSYYGRLGKICVIGAISLSYACLMNNGVFFTYLQSLLLLLPTTNLLSDVVLMEKSMPFKSLRV